MKLELKHLAPYLPYGLKILPTLYNRDNKINTLYYLSTIYNSDEFGVNGYTSNYIKPILRPLSDLTKEIEHNGEKFVPYYWFGRQGINIESILDERWHIVQKLLSWHFDVFGLLDKGLAIDINTL